MTVSGELAIHPATGERWPDLEQLFGPRGACAGCWCMWFRLPNRDFEEQKGERNREALRALVAAGEEPWKAPPGLIAYSGGEAVGWCAVAPRTAYGRLGRSRILAPVDQRPVWSIVCLFVDRRHRRKGISEALIGAAVDLAAKHGATTVEGYPIEPKKDEVPPVFAYHGLVSSFLRQGFVEVARRSPTRPIVRRELASGAAAPER